MEPAGRTAPKTKWWLFAVKAVVSAGLFAWIVKDVDLGKVVSVIRNADPVLLASAFGLFFLGYLLTALRWRSLMSIHGVNPPLHVLVQSFMVGIFFNNLLPSTIGGDVSRMYDVWRIAKDKVSAVSVVLVDRFMGVLALILWASAAVAVSTEIRAIPAVTVPVLMVLIAALVVAALIFGRPRAILSRLGGVSDQLIRAMPSFLAAPARKVAAAFGPYYDRSPVLLRALAISLVLQLNVIIHFWLIARALDIQIPLLALCVVIPCALMIMMLPISINAIGVREATFVYFMSLFGVGGEKAVVFAWVAFFFVLFQGLLGGLVFALRRAPPDLSQT